MHVDHVCVKGLCLTKLFMKELCLRLFERVVCDRVACDIVVSDIAVCVTLPRVKGLCDNFACEKIEGTPLLSLSATHACHPNVP